MAAIGPPTGAMIPDNALPVADVAITVGAADQPVSGIFTSGVIRQVYCNSAGTLYLQNQYGVMVAYTVVAGTKLFGNFKAIGGTTNQPSATNGLTLVASQ